MEPLTPREEQVARLVARGHSYKAIASELGISTQTIQQHVSSAASKLPGRGSPKTKLIVFTLQTTGRRQAI